MTVVTPYSTLITNLEAMPPVLPSPWQHRGPVCRSHVRMARAAADSANSLYRLMRVNSSFLFTGVAFLTDTWGTSGAIDVGFYDVPSVNAGAIVGTGQELGASIDVSSAITANKELANIAGQAAMEQRVWERLGLLSDPNKDYDIVVKAVNAGTGVVANFWMSVSYQR